MNTRNSSDSLFGRRSRASILAALVLGGMTACGGGGGSTPTQTATSAPGSHALKPGGGWFIADPNKAGNSQTPRMVRMAYGRMVEVFGLDPFNARVPMFSEFIIASDLVSDGQNYALETNPVTGQQLLTILRDVTDTSNNGGRDQFFNLILQAEQGLSPIHEADGQGAGLYSMVPRNSAIVLFFDDLVDASTLTGTTLRLNVGSPATLPFEARVFVDPNHGDLANHDGAGGNEFYGTRIIVDPTVSELESFSQDPPLPVNGVGLPPSVDVNLANFEIRIPTQLNTNGGQLHLLRNPSGHALASTGNGPMDNAYGTMDVIRAARAGGSESVTGDVFNGFLADSVPPLLVGNTPLEIVDAPEQQTDPDLFRLPLIRFSSTFCAQTPIIGDVIRQPGLFAEVVNQPAPVDPLGEVHDVMVRILLHPFGAPSEWENAGQGSGQFLSAYDAVADLGREACFVRVFPDSQGWPTNPVDGISTDATYSMRFSEPMDPTSLTAFDSVTITRSPIPAEGGLNTSEYVVGSLTQSIDLQEFTFLTDLPLAHNLGAAENYWLSLAIGEEGPVDLAGNELTIPFPSVMMTIDPTEAPQHNSGRVTRFSSVDEEPPFGTPETGPLPEWGGQLLYDLQRKLIKPRPVVHFNAICDRTQPVPKLMTEFPPGVQTPLSGLGSIMQTCWRYCDFGWSLTDATNHNIDVLGLYWSPSAGEVNTEIFSEFSIKVGHSKFLPDEYIDPSSLFPDYKDSGIVRKFDNNWLRKSAAKIMHARQKGYTVSPGDLFEHPITGTKLVPYPWNQNEAPEDWKTYTWRDTDERRRGGKFSAGAPLDQEYIATGQVMPDNVAQGYYAANHVRTDGLPLLMEFKCYPEPGVVGVNAFDISLACNTSARPYFRSFSTGGIDSGGNSQVVNPDEEEEASGGYNPGAGGATTYGLDNTYYIGAADFVTRISRVHSVWFEALDPFVGGGATFSAPTYNEPILEPRMEDQPIGTDVVLAYRGATEFRTDRHKCCDLVAQANGIPNRQPLENAQTLDSFGDYYDSGCEDEDPLLIPVHNTTQQNRTCDANNGGNKVLMTFFNDDDEWLDEISEIAGAPYYQVRITFESNIVSGLTPELSAIAVSWFE